jgi:hypothetical protein
MYTKHTKRVIVFGVQYSVNIMGGYRGIHGLSWSERFPRARGVFAIKRPQNWRICRFSTRARAAFEAMDLLIIASA